MSDETLTGEVKFEYQQVTAGFDKIADGLAKLGADAGRELGGLGDQFKKFADEQEKAFGSLQEQRIEALGAKLADFGRKGFGALGSFIQPAIEFQAEMANVDAVAKLSQGDLAEFTERIRTLGKEIGVTVDPVKAAAGAYDIIGAGFTSAADSEKVLTAAIKDSRAGRAELTDATDVLTTVLNSYSLTADQAAVVSDKLLKTVDLGKTTFPQLAQSLGLVASSAAQSGVSLDELSGVMALATANGIRTSSAAEGLRSLIGNLVKPSSEAQKEFAKLGIQVDGATLKAKGLVKTLQEISVAAKGNSGALATIFADASGRTLAESLIGNDNGTKLANFVKQMESAAGATDASLKRQSASAKVAREEFDAAFKVFEIGVSEKALPALTGVFKFGSDVLGVMDKIPGPVKSAGLAFAGLGFALAAVSGTVIGLQFALPILTAEVSALAAVVATRLAPAFVALGPILKAGVLEGLGGLISLGFGAVLEGIAAAATGLATAIGTAATAVAVFSPIVAGLAVAGTIAAAVFGPLGQLSVELAKADDALVSANSSLVEFGKSAKLSLGTILHDSVKEIADAGGTLVDFAARIMQVQNELEEARKDPAREADVVRLQKQLADLVAKKGELGNELDSRKKPAAAQAPGGPLKTAADLEKERKERLAADLFEIETSKKTAGEKARLLTELLNKEQRTAEEQINIKRKIFTELEKVDRDATDLLGKQRQQAIEQSEFEIEHSKGTTAEKIAGLKAVIATFGLEGDAKRAVLSKIDQLEKKAADDEAERIKQLSDLRAQANEKRAQQSQDFLEELQRQEDRGIDTSAQQVDVLAAKAEAERQKIKEALKADLAKVKDPATQKQIRQNSQADLDKVDRDQAKGTRDVQQKGLEDRLTLQKEAASAEVQLSGIKIGLLKDELLAGKDVQSQFEQAVLKRLELTEQQIKLEAQLEASRTDNAQKQQRIELEAQAKILEAHRSTRKEIDEATKALQRQKQAESGGDTIQTLDQVLKEQSDTFGRDAVRKRTDEIRAKNSSGTGRVPFNLSDAALKAEVNDLANRAERSRLNPDLFQNASLAGRIPGADSAGGPRPTSNVQLQATIRLLGEDGKEKPFKIESQQVTVDGQNSRPSILANRFSKSFAGV